MSPSNQPDVTADVVVIGGGPGGSTAATMLARKGVRVLLLEREQFPRDHVGESLLPASIPVFEELGVLPTIEDSGFLPKRGATMVWGRETTPWSWYFRETNQRYPHSYQVWRPQFDQLLLENSASNGVDVRQGCHVSEVLFEDGKATGVRYTGEDGGRRTARAQFVVDASGQSALLARRVKLRRWDSFFRNLAVYGYFAGAQRLPRPDETNIFIESYPRGWIWDIPLHTGCASVGAVVDSRTGGDGIRRKGTRRFLTDQIAQAPYTAKMLRNAELASGPFVAKDWSYVSEQLFGDGFILVGDAACFVDPLFSSGVHLALMSGVLAAAYVVAALKDESIRDAAGKMYAELYHKEYSHFRDLVRLFYASNRTVDSYFWEARRLVDADLDLSPRHSFIRAVAGQPPRGYERAVLDRGAAPAGFVSSVRAVESDRAERRVRLAAARTNADITQSTLFHSVPRLAEGVRAERKPVLGEGEFVWGYALTAASRQESTPCSGFVAKLISLIDGRTSVSELLARLGKETDESGKAHILTNAVSALEILYVDGTIADLKGE